MIEKNKDARPEMTWQVMDITDMSALKTDSFDLVFDKGTIDTLLCGDDFLTKVAQMLKETQRVLVTGGHYFVVSYGKPESRSNHFIRGFLSWERREFILYERNIEKEEDKKEIKEEEEEEEENKTHYIYVCTKNDDANEVSNKYFDIEFENLMEEKYL